MNKQEVEDHIVFSQFYPEAYPQATVPQQGETKRRRRRKKNKSAAEEGESGAIWMKKRKLSTEQVTLLELSFENEHKLESERKDRLASELGLDPRQVAVWFQNRRARWKNKKLEEEYSRLKSAHENVVVEKCRLENEVIKLKEQLKEAETEIQKLTERNGIDGASSNSPSSSLSMEAMDAPLLLGEFAADMVDGYDYGYDSALYMPQNPYVNGMDWNHLFPPS